MASTITRDTLLPLGLITGLLAVAVFVGAQNQKLDSMADDVREMKPAIVQAQLDIASIKATLAPGPRTMSIDGPLSSAKAK